MEIRRAYVHAEAKRDIYVELPEEDAEPGMCGKLVKAMYGTRDAAANWESHFRIQLESYRFVSGLSSPCLFYHQ